MRLNSLLHISYSAMASEKAFLSESYNGAYWSSTYKHQESLKDMVRDLSVKEFDIAIRLAITAIQNMNQAAGTVQYREALSSEIGRLTRIHDSEKEGLAARLNSEREKGDALLQARIASLESQLLGLRASAAASDEAANKLREQMQRSDSIFHDSLARILEKKKANMKENLLDMWNHIEQ